MALLLLLCGVYGTFLAAYPFTVEGDGALYYHDMYKTGRSSLVLAGGYPFSWQPLRTLARLLHCEDAQLMRYLQPLFLLTSTVLLYVALCRVTRVFFAFLAALFVSTEFNLLSAAATTRPEFFQAGLLMLLLALLILAFSDTRWRTKLALYCAAAACFVLSYLTKYNSLPAAILFVVVFFDRRLYRHERYPLVVGMAASGAAVWLLFLGTFHYASTGTIALNLEHGWIHVQKLRLAQIPLEADSGLATTKFLALAHSLPDEGGAVPSMWWSIDKIPDEARAPYRAEFGPWLHLQDREQVRAIYERALAANGGAALNLDTAHFRIYAHLGLKEAERLLQSVFFEGIRAYPKRYFRHVASQYWRGIRFEKIYGPYLPTADQLARYEQHDGALVEDRAHVLFENNWSEASYPKLAAATWRPAAALVSHLAIGRSTLDTWIWLPTAVVTLLLFADILRGAWRWDTLVAALLCSFLVAFITFSALLFEVRGKELVVILPLLHVAAILSLGDLAHRLLSRASRFANATREASSSASIDGTHHHARGPFRKFAA